MTAVDAEGMTVETTESTVDAEDTRGPKAPQLRKAFAWVSGRTWIEGLSLILLVVTAPPAVKYWLGPTPKTPGWAITSQIWLLLWLGILSILTVVLFKQSRTQETAHGATVAQKAGEIATLTSANLALTTQNNQWADEYLRFGNLLEQYHNSFHDLRTSSHLLATSAGGGTFDTAVEERWSRSLESALRSLAEFYTSHTGHPCHAVIKQLIPPHGEPTVGLTNVSVLAIARSHPHGVPATYERRVALNENSDFRDLLQKPTMRYFFCNDLDNLKGYENPTRGNPPRYNSSIVWPIRGPRPMLGGGESPEDAPSLAIGFVAVDSAGTNVFTDPLHAWLGAGFADSLFAVMSLRLALGAQVARPQADA